MLRAWLALSTHIFNPGMLSDLFNGSSTRAVPGFWGIRVVSVLLVLSAVVLPIAHGQGLLIGDKPARADVTYTSKFGRHHAQYKSATRIKQSVRSSRGGVSLGSAGSDLAALEMATSPSVYSTLDTKWTGGKRVIPPVSDQRPCAACVAHALIAAAQAAVASLTGMDVVSGLDRLSVQDFYWCSEGYRDCGDGWLLKDAAQALQWRGASLLKDSCLPWSPQYRGGRDRAALCDTPRRCSGRGEVASQGSFEFRPLSEVWQVQSHIRQYGAVVTRFDIYSDFRPFFSSPANKGKVYARSPNAKLQEPHAIVLVGYNDDKKHWVARNSWGPNWGDNGYFKVAYETANVLSEGETFGIIWTTSQPGLVPLLTVTPAPPQRPGCFVYKAAPGDFLSKVAWRVGVPLSKLLADNTAAVTDLDAPLAGKLLLLCNPLAGTVDSPSATGKAPTGAGGSSGDRLLSSQLRALLEVKAAVDKNGVLTDWTVERGARGGYCDDKSFKFVLCDGDKNVVEINTYTLGSLGGTLPPADVLRGLPFLKAVDFGANGLGGTLPPDWGTLAQLEDMRISLNPGIRGPIPKEWSRLSRLKVLYLYRNSQSGTLPPALGEGCTAMEEMDVAQNSLSGPLPAEWSKMTMMKKLSLFNNSLTGTLPPELGEGWTAMEELELDGNSLSGPLPAEWSKMTRMKKLALSNNSLTGTLPPELGEGWTAMEDLQLDGNSLSGPLPAEWSKMTRMKRLYLYKNHLTGPLPPELGEGWTAMEELELDGNSLSGPLPAEWSKMKSIMKLYLSKNRLTGTLPPELGEGWTAMEELELDCNSLSGPLPAEWSKMMRMKSLYLYNNRLTGTLPPELGDEGWTAVEELLLAINSLTGPLPAEWSKMTRMKRLALSNNTLTGPLPSQWSSMAGIERVSLRNNRLTGTLPSAWGNSWRSVKDISLNSNRLIGTIPQSWGLLGKTLAFLRLNANPGLKGCLPRALEKFKGNTDTCKGTGLKCSAC